MPSAASGGAAQLRLENRSGYLADQLHVAERRAVMSVAEIEVSSGHRLLVDGIIDPERMERQPERQIVHEMAADLIGAIGEAGRHRAIAEASSSKAELTAPAARTTAFAQAEASRRSSGRRRSQSRLPPASVSRRTTRAPVTNETFSYMSARQGRRSSVHLAGTGIGERVPRRLAALQPGFDVDAQRQRECGGRPALTACANRRSPARRHGRKGVRRRMRRFGWVSWPARRAPDRASPPAYQGSNSS